MKVAKRKNMAGPERYLTDERGKRVGVVLGIEEYEKMLDDLDELDAIRAYDEAKASGEKPIPWSEAKKRLNLPES
ncbi:MAG: hypothetical protein ACREQY_14465 [Candidatus Binatia bacterium]